MLCFYLALLPGCAGDTETTEVRSAFDRYITAIQLRDGEAAADELSKSSQDYYQSLLDYSLDLDERKTRALPVVDKITVVMIRNLIPASQVREMNGRDLIVYAVTYGWIGTEGIENIANGTVTMEPRVIYDEAWCDVVDSSSGTRTDNLLRFVKESGRWKLDLVHLIMAVEPELRRAITGTEMTEDQFVEFDAGTKSGQRVRDSVWQPLGR